MATIKDYFHHLRLFAGDRKKTPTNLNFTATMCIYSLFCGIGRYAFLLCGCNWAEYLPRLSRMSMTLTIKSLIYLLHVLS